MSILSRFGIGSASIDLIPDETKVKPGGEVEAHLELLGGRSPQTVTDIEIALVTRYRAQRQDDSYPTHYVLWETEFKEGFTVEPEVDRSIDVPDIQVPACTPVTLGTTEVWIQSGLDIEWALDPADEDQLEVLPRPRLQGVMDAMERLDFELRDVSNEEADVPRVSTPFLQRFTFSSTNSSGSSVDSVYVWPVREEDPDDLSIRITRKALGAGNAPVSVSIESENPATIADRLQSALRSL